MITPEYLNQIMYDVEEKIVEVDNYIIKKIAQRIVKTFEAVEETNLFIPSTQADVRKLMLSGVLYEDIMIELQKIIPNLSGAIKDAFYQSAGEINKQNIEISQAIIKHENLGIDLPDIKFAEYPKVSADLYMTKAEIMALESAYRRTNQEMVNIVHSMPQKANIEYIQACDNAFMRIKAGVSYQTAVIDAIKEISDKGAQVEYAGRSDNIEVAIARAVRTGINQANADITIIGCAEKGINCVKTSAHMGARVTPENNFTNHSWWQGKVYSLDWNSKGLSQYKNIAYQNEKGFEWTAQMREKLSEIKQKYDYPDFVESCGFGNIQGICGINCRHSFYQFHPGIQLNDDDRPNLDKNEEFYKKTQKQRRMEVSIRDTKRELQAFKSCGLKTKEVRAEITRLSDKLKFKTNKYMDFCRENNLKPRNSALFV